MKLKLKLFVLELSLGFSAILNIYMAFTVLYKFMDILALLPSVLSPYVVKMGVEKVREFMPFQAENARNWALVRGDDLIEYAVNWKVFTATITMMLVLAVNYILYSIFG